MADGYDDLAPDYDSHFTRPVDRWEDDRLTGILRPVVDENNVLDLGCGTGWLLDHTTPAHCTAVDSAAGMLAELIRKHPRVTAVKAEVGADGWHEAIPRLNRPFDAVTSTWALQYLFPEGDAGELAALLAECRRLVRPGGVIALHGYLPRYRNRHHYIGWPRHVPPVVRPDVVARASATSGLHGPRLIGCGALPDALAVSERLWQGALSLPGGWHYSGLWMWSRT